MGNWWKMDMRAWIARGVLTVAAAAVAVLSAVPAQATRIKDLASIDGVRDNQLIGFGLVGGLSGTGDDPKSAPYTGEAIANMLATFGFQVEPATVKVKNFAAVMVTVDLPAYVSNGDRLDITVSSIGTAKSLEGGQLYMTLLRGADDEVYAVAQGKVSLGSTVGGDGGAKGAVKTVGRVPDGALVEKAVASTLVKLDGGIHLNLNHPDFTTAAAVVQSIDAAFGPSSAQALDAGTVRVNIPPDFGYDIVPFVALIENLEAAPGTIARVVVNQRTGTVVIGQDVTILPVAVTHRSMTLTFGEQVKSPGLGSDVAVEEGGIGGMPVIAGEPEEEPVTVAQPLDEGLLTSSTTAAEVALGLNKMNLAPADIVAIFEAIAAAGALMGTLEII